MTTIIGALLLPFDCTPNQCARWSFIHYTPPREFKPFAHMIGNEDCI